VGVNAGERLEISPSAALEKQSAGEGLSEKTNEEAGPNPKTKGKLPAKKNHRTT